MAIHNEIGKLGENIACTFLENKGYKIIDRNYRKKWGEIDIIAQDSKRITYFVEVKTVSKHYTCNTGSYKFYNSSTDAWQPEEMVHASKIRRLRRVIQTYITQYSIQEWTFGIVIVQLDMKTRMATCKHIKDIIL